MGNQSPSCGVHASIDRSGSEQSRTLSVVNRLTCPVRTTASDLLAHAIMLQARKTSRTARPTPAGPRPLPKLRPSSIPPPLPRAVVAAQWVMKPKVPAAPTAVAEAEVSEVRSVSGIAATIAALDEATLKQIAPPPQLAKRSVGEVTREWVSPGEANRALARMFPIDPRTRVLRLGAAVALLIAYTTVAAFRWALRGAPVLCRKMSRQALVLARTVFAQARYRVRVEWLHATAVARASR